MGMSVRSTIKSLKRLPTWLSHALTRAQVWHQWTDTSILAIQRDQFFSLAAWWEFMSAQLSKDELMVAIYGIASGRADQGGYSGAWHVYEGNFRRANWE